MLYLFDLDGTLVSSYMDNPDKDYHTWHLLPGRKERLQELAAQGHQLAVITNQRGVAFGFITQEEMWCKLEAVGAALDTPGILVWYCCGDVRGKPPWNDSSEARRAKPSGEMLREAMRYYQTFPKKTMMVGDGPEDEQAAQDAGVPFQWAHAFFGDAQRG